MTTPERAGPALHGIFTPNVVPLTPAGDIDEQELRRYLDWLIAKGVHGLYCNGSTGEFIRFSLDERRQIARIVCDACRGRVPVLAGATEGNVKEVLKSCEMYAEYGARAISLLPPIYFKVSPEGVYAWFAEVARHSPIDITLYNIPMFCTPMDVPTIARLAGEFPRIIAIKDSSGDVSQFARLIAAVRPVRPDFVFFSGWETTLVPQLVLGAHGGVHATGGVLPELMRRMYDRFRAGDLAEATRVQYRLLEFFDVMIGAGDFPEGVRAAVALRGFAVGPSRQPTSPRQSIDRTKLDAALRQALAALDGGAGGA